jgi:hypothetical protein
MCSAWNVKRDATWLIGVAMLLGFSSVGRALTAPQTTTIPADRQLTESEASDLQNQFFEAMIAHDQKQLDAFSGDDLTYNHVGGLMQSKAEFLSWVAGRQFVKFDFHITKAFLSRDTTVLTGKVAVSSRQDTTDAIRDTPYVLTTVWQRKNTGWQLVLVQFTGVDSHR